MTLFHIPAVFQSVPAVTGHDSPSSADRYSYNTQYFNTPMPVSAQPNLHNVYITHYYVLFMTLFHVLALSQSVPAVTVRDSPSSADPYSYTWPATYDGVSGHVGVELVLLLSRVSSHPAPAYTANTGIVIKTSLMAHYATCLLYTSPSPRD